MNGYSINSYFEIVYKFYFLSGISVLPLLKPNRRPEKTLSK